MQRRSLQTHRGQGVYFKQERIEKETDTGSARTSVAYENASCSKEKEVLVKMQMLRIRIISLGYKKQHLAYLLSTFWLLVYTARYPQNLFVSVYFHPGFVD